MLFGLCNAQATFQRADERGLTGLDPEVCQVYLDDITVHSHDLDSYIGRLERLFERLPRAGLKLKVSKCMLL